MTIAVVLILSALVLGFVFWKMVVFVPANTVFVKERLGQFSRILEPGVHILIPNIDRIAHRHESGEQMFQVPPQACSTADKAQVTVNGRIYLKVADPQKATYQVEDYRSACVNLVQTAARSEVGQLTQQECLYERWKLNERVEQKMIAAAEPWGIKVLRFETKDITGS